MFEIVCFGFQNGESSAGVHVSLLVCEAVKYDLAKGYSQYNTCLDSAVYW
jgi:hypothetical protein